MRKFAILFLSITSVFALFSACDRSQEEGLCENERNFLSVFDTIQARVDPGLSDEEIISSIEEQTGFDRCEGIYFDAIMPYGLHDSVSMGFTVSPQRSCSLIPICGRIRCDLFFRINAYSHILMNISVVSLENVRDSTFTLLTSVVNPPSILRIKKDSLVPDSIARSVFDSVVRAYLDYGHHLSLREFNKPLCDLDSDQLRQIRNRVRLTLYIEQERQEFYYRKD